jgi:hypothetical protein
MHSAYVIQIRLLLTTYAPAHAIVFIILVAVKGFSDRNLYVFRQNHTKDFTHQSEQN